MRRTLKATVTNAHRPPRPQNLPSRTVPELRPGTHVEPDRPPAAAPPDWPRDLKKLLRKIWAARQNKKGLHRCKPLIFLVGRAGFEPATTALKVQCSTD